MIGELSKASHQNKEIFLDFEKQEKLPFEDENSAESKENISQNKMSDQSEDDVLFEEFLKGIPIECVRTHNIFETEEDNNPIVAEVKNPIKHNEDHNLCDIEQLSGMSSIENVEEKEDHEISNKESSKKSEKNNQNKGNYEEKDIEKEESLENDEEIPFNAGFGDFLKEMERLAKDASFEEETHDIWSEDKLDHEKETLLEGEKETEENSLSKVESTYVIDFSEDFNKERPHHKPVEKIVSEVERIYKKFTARQENIKILSEKESQYINKLKELVSFGELTFLEKNTSL